MRAARGNTGHHTWVAGLLLAALHGSGSAAAPDFTAVDAAIDDAMSRYRLPGIAVGIVEQGRVVHVRTAGERVAGEGAPITRRTLFKIASNSKSMTTATLARLVDAGKLAWDDPVTRHLPQLRMSDPWVTREIQVRDLLIHNSGLPAGAGDLMLWPEPNHFTRADVIAGLAHLRPVRSFRSGYAYDNVLYIVAGEVAAAAGGESYETLVRRHVFEPLGMSRCQVGEWRRDEVGDVAQPHMRVGDRNVPIRRDGAVIPRGTADAAGGIRCSLDDMLKWIGAWLAPSPQAASWLSPAQREALWSAQMPMPVSARQRAWDGSSFHAYGYGWRLSDVDGQFKVSHTGTLAGMYSVTTLLPRLGVGFVILINGEADAARTALNQVLVKRYTAPDSEATVARYAEWIALETPPPAPRAPAATADRRPAAPLALADRLGRWRDPWFGEVSICAEGDRVRFAAHKSPLLSGTVMQVGTRLLVDWDDPVVDTEAWLDFDASGGADGALLRMAKVDAEADFSSDYEDLRFTRSGACD